MIDLKTLYSYPVENNCEVIGCSTPDCENETVVLQKDYISSFTCSTCYAMIITKKKK